MSPSPSPSAYSTARRNLMQRTERFLDNVGVRELDAWARWQLVQAIDQLEAGNFADGERAMLYAERALEHTV